MKQIELYPEDTLKVLRALLVSERKALAVFTKAARISTRERKRCQKSVKKLAAEIAARKTK